MLLLIETAIFAINPTNGGRPPFFIASPLDRGPREEKPLLREAFSLISARFSRNRLYRRKRKKEEIDFPGVQPQYRAVPIPAKLPSICSFWKWVFVFPHAIPQLDRNRFFREKVPLNCPPFSLETFSGNWLSEIFFKQ